MRRGEVYAHLCCTRPRGTWAFTLIELLVVIAIIGLLVSILVPSISRVKELARRAYCANNLRSWGLAVALYAETHGSYPYVPLNGAGWGASIGTNRNVNPFGGAPRDRSPSGTLYLMVRDPSGTRLEIPFTWWRGSIF